MKLCRRDVLARRISVQQLDRQTDPRRSLTGADVFDFGVQDTGRDGASWALVNRGVPVEHPETLHAASELALVWTLRGAPHFYRRADLVDVLTATSPLSEADAVKRVVGAGKPLKEAGISTLDGLAEVAGQMRRVVTAPLGKGEVSTRLTRRLGPPYLRECRPCNAVHSWEVPFRIGALYGGLELEPGTSPPVLRRVPDWPRRRPGPASDPTSAPDRLQPIRGCLRFLGPTTPHDVAGFLDAPVTVIKQHWPKDAVEVTVDGTPRWLLGAAEPTTDGKLVRMLGPYDLFLQARDRDLLVPETARHKALWPVIGRPGALLVGTDIVGTWRPRASGSSLTVVCQTWTSVSSRNRSSIKEQAERLADHRGVALSTVEGLG